MPLDPNSLLSGVLDDLSGVEPDDLSGDDLGAIAAAALQSGLREKVIPLSASSYTIAKGGTNSQTFTCTPGHEFVVTRMVIQCETASGLECLSVTDIQVDRKSQLEVSGDVPAKSFAHDSNVSMQLDKLPNKIDATVVIANRSTATDVANVKVAFHGYTASNLRRLISRRK